MFTRLPSTTVTTATDHNNNNYNKRRRQCSCKEATTGITLPKLMTLKRACRTKRAWIEYVVTTTTTTTLATVLIRLLLLWQTCSSDVVVVLLVDASTTSSTVAVASTSVSSSGMTAMSGIRSTTIPTSSSSSPSVHETVSQSAPQHEFHEVVVFDSPALTIPLVDVDDTSPTTTLLMSSSSSSPSSSSIATQRLQTGFYFVAWYLLNICYNSTYVQYYLLNTINGSHFTHSKHMFLPIVTSSLHCLVQ
jgi:hypothetical protein